MKKNLFLILVFFTATNLSLFAEKTKTYRPTTHSIPNKQQERTLSIIKPGAVANKLTGEILTRFERANLRIVAIKKLWLSPQQAKQFYAVHKNRPFFNDLISFMTSGPVVVSVLEGEKAIERNRKLMGPTDPIKAPAGTIRSDFAKNVTANAVHGSDAIETAKQEINFFFPEL